MKEPIIEFQNFSFKYRTQIEPTLIDINLKIYPGEKILIVGPSGSGKSTLGQCINGLIPNAYKGDVSGELLVSGKNPKEVGVFEISKEVGTVLQDPDGQFIGLTVAEDIAFAMENDCVEQSVMKQKVRECAEKVGIFEYLDHAPHALSGGQKQRVSIAGVITENVKILLFDEPLANLDPSAGKYAIELIDDIHKETDTTILIIEHRLEDVLHRDLDRIIVMNDGRIVADMNPDAILASGVLEEVGIREPLYLTAAKYAGFEVHEKKSLSHLSEMMDETDKENVVKWFHSIPSRKVEVEPPTVLELEAIEFSYEEQKNIVNDISFQIKKGEMISIVGKNGAGKTTLSKLICGFEFPQGGKLYYYGRNMEKDSIKERAEKIGLVMQNPNQMISKPMIFDEVSMGLRARGMDEEQIKEKVEATLKICGLYPFRNWPIAALSFGQKKRVTIASILVLDPQILILDEPTAGQDFRHYSEIMEFLERLNVEHGITIIMITHDMHLMLEYTRRALVISEGRLLSDTFSATVLTDHELVEEASLKLTSLYELAELCGIDDKTEFVERFIAYDREVRQHA